jgi:hypothetical protein
MIGAWRFDLQREPYFSDPLAPVLQSPLLFHFRCASREGADRELAFDPAHIGSSCWLPHATCKCGNKEIDIAAL